jgi:hypothetical protein
MAQAKSGFLASLGMTNVSFGMTIPFGETNRLQSDKDVLVLNYFIVNYCQKWELHD